MSQTEYNIRGDVQHSGIPPELRHLDQWLAYRAVPKPNGKINKPPIDAKTGKAGSSTDPATWSGYDLAAARSPVGAAFVLTESDPYVAIDLDTCVAPETGEIAPWAQAIVERFPIYWEVSYSGTGLRGIGRGLLVRDGRKKGDIEVYDDARLVVMTGRTLPGHGVIRNCQRQLMAWHSEVWPVESERPKPPSPTFTSTRLTNEQILEIAFRAQNGDSIRRLYDGDISGYPESQSDPGFSSEADLALVSRLAFYTTDDELLVDLWRGSGLYRRKLDRSDYVQRTIQKARASQSDAYAPGYASRTGAPEPEPAGASCGVLLAAARAELAQARQTILVLQERVRLADEREAIQRNTKLGAPRQTAAALATLFKEERPKEPGTPTPYRMPLAKLAERTGLSADACSRQLKKLAEYRTPAGDHVLYTDTRPVPRRIDQETGEIIEPHKEVWVGPGVDRSAFGYILAQLAPADAPKHGGKPDRNACPEHPDAGVLRRTKTTRKITRECAHCHLILDVQVIPVGRETTDHIPVGRPIQHHAFTHEGDDPETTDPFQHHAFGDDDAPETDLGPMPQDAASIDNHVGYDLSGKMRHSPSLLNDARPESSGPPPGWEDRHRHAYGQVYRGEAAS
jgi:hypothetical protein